MGTKWNLGRLAGVYVCGVDSSGSGQGLVVGSCECGYEPLGSGATELVSCHSSPLNIMAGKGAYFLIEEKVFHKMLFSETMSEKL
jgi:hypothetical protein